MARTTPAHALRRRVVAAFAAAVAGAALTLGAAAPATAVPVAQTLPAGQSMYAFDCNSSNGWPGLQLFSIDVGPATATPIGSGESPENIACPIQGGWNPADGKAYVATGFNDRFALRAVDTSTGLTTAPVPVTLGGDDWMQSLAAVTFLPDGTAYAIASVDWTVDLFRLDVHTGALTRVGDADGIRSLAADPTTGTLYGMTDAGVVKTLDKDDATATEIGTVDLRSGYSPSRMLVDLDGTLWFSLQHWDTSIGYLMTLATADPADIAGTTAYSGSHLTVDIAGEAKRVYSQSFFLSQPSTASAPSISGQPASTTTAVGGVARFTVTASGAPQPSYQWQRHTGGSWTDIAGATSATLEFSAALGDGGDYRVKVSNSQGEVFSHAATLTVASAPILGGYPASASLVRGISYSATPVTSGTGPFTYQITAGTLPSGVTFDSATGKISGTPTALGSYTVTIKATNAAGSDEVSISFRVGSGTPDSTIKFGFGAGAAVTDGLDLRVQGKDLMPGTTWTLQMFSTPTTIGTGVVGAAGVIDGIVTLPTDTPAGAHRLLLSGTGITGEEVTSQGWFALDENGTVLAVSLTGPVSASAVAGRGLDSDSLASAGFGGGAAGIGAALIVLLGAALTVRGRRRSTV